MMLRSIVFIVVLNFSFTSYAEVNARAYRADGNTPLEVLDSNFPNEYVDIMIGTKLTIVVDSNVVIEDGMWALYIEDDDRSYGRLYGKGPAPSYPESVLEAAGIGAAVEFWQFFLEPENKDVNGFHLYSGYEDVNIGNWFIIDYNAVDVGDCNVAFYWWDWLSIPDHGLIYELQFNHVPTRDFNGDTQVDFEDFSILATYWQADDCGDPNSCEGVNLDFSGLIDVNDLILFSEFWLEKTQ